ncbi:MAG: peptidylprolyl isomerase [Elusimicrobia bacterium]|nr:peptidylprolyl isomerase [Elusimicrobiota bacterium]
MRSLNRILLAAVLAFGASLAWAARVEDVVARVNSKPLLLSEYRKNVRSVMENYSRNLPQLVRDEEALKEIRAKVLDQMVDDELLAQEGEKLGFKIHQRELDKGVEEVQERNFRVDDLTGKRRSDSEAKAALAAELDKEGLSDEQFRERIRRQILVQKVVDEKVRPLVKDPDEKRIQQAFEKLKAVASGSTDVVKGMPEEIGQTYVAFGYRLRDMSSERVRVSHILVKIVSSGLSPTMVERNQALQRAGEIKKKIEGGADFGETAGKESDDIESARRGGDLGIILRGWMPPEFEKAAFSLQPGVVGEPVETKFGYHLLLVQEKKIKETLTLEKIKDDVAKFLSSVDSRTELQNYIKKLRSAATIEITRSESGQK